VDSSRVISMQVVAFPDAPWSIGSERDQLPLWFEGALTSIGLFLVAVGTIFGQEWSKHPSSSASESKDATPS
jgi:hypothetical protein